MTKESKQAVLDAFDALVKVETDSYIEARHPKGGSFKCGICGGLRASNPPHQPDCNIGKAIKALQPIVPYYQNRQAWMDSAQSPSEFVAAQGPVA